MQSIRPRRSLLLSLAVLTFILGGFAHGSEERSQPPNVILVMADDLGWGDLRCFDNATPIQTPHLDEMCRHGLRFTRFYAASSVCSPTRGACLTGRHPERYGIHTANSGHLIADEICLSTVLQEHGYATGHFGKWHLGTLSRDYSGKGPKRNPARNFCTPGNRGFDEWFSTEFAVATWNPYDPSNSHLGDKAYDTRALYWHNGQNVTQPLTGCDSQIIMDRALPFIEASARGQQPFFAVVWFHAPHQPVVGGPEYLRRYRDYPVEQQHYYAVVTALDDQIGRLRAELRRLGVADNTMLWFCSDNGPEGNPGPAGRSQGSAGPFRGRKRSLYEGGVRVPGILEWPAVVKSRHVTDAACVTSDYFETILAAAGIRAAETWPQRDGVNLMPIIQRTVAKRAQPIGFSFGKQSSWVEHRFKLVHNLEPSARHRSDNGSVRPANGNCTTCWLTQARRTISPRSIQKPSLGCASSFSSGCNRCHKDNGQATARPCNSTTGGGA